MAEEEEAKKEETPVEEGQTLEDVLISYAKRYNGYPYVSASRIENVPADAKDQSIMLRNIIMHYIMRGGTDQEEFKKHFCTKDLLIVSVHQKMPILAKDGLYDSMDAAGHFNKTIPVGQFHILNPETFEPFVLIKTQTGYSKVVGDPAPQLSKEMIQTIMLNQIAEQKAKEQQ